MVDWFSIHDVLANSDPLITFYIASIFVFAHPYVSILTLCLCILASFYLGLFLRLRHRRTTSELSGTSASLIVAFQDEKKDFGNFSVALTKLKELPDEIILVHDGKQPLNVYQKMLPQNITSYIKLIPNAYQKGKKSAVRTGIEAARNEYVLLTDIDCIPNSDHWVSNMKAAIGPQDVLLGYAPFFKEKGLVNRFSRYENSLTAMLYMSFASVNWPYMGVGRSMMYRKKLFTEVGGFSKHEHLRSGDDDLFISSLPKKSAIAYTLDKDTLMYSKTAKNWNDFIRQKKRHLTTATSYRFGHQMALFLWALSHTLFYVTLFVGLAMGHYFLLYFWVLKLAIQIGTFSLLRNCMDLRGQSWEQIYLDPMFALYLLGMSPYLWIKSKTRW